MTLQYLQLHRYNAQPRAKHIDTPESQAPVYTNLEELIADMHRDAKAIKSRMSSEKLTDTTQEDVSDETILKVVAGKPGSTVYEIAKAIHRSPNNIRVRLRAMEKRGQVKIETYLHPQSNRWSRLYHPVKNPPKRKAKPRPSPVRDKVIAFIEANPGCSTPELARHMGCSVKAAAAHVSEARKVVNVRSERPRGNGNHTPARHWIEV